MWIPVRRSSTLWNRQELQPLRYRWTCLKVKEFWSSSCLKFTNLKSTTFHFLLKSSPTHSKSASMYDETLSSTLLSCIWATTTRWNSTTRCNSQQRAQLSNLALRWWTDCSNPNQTNSHQPQQAPSSSLLQALQSLRDRAFMTAWLCRLGAFKIEARKWPHLMTNSRSSSTNTTVTMPEILCSTSSSMHSARFRQLRPKASEISLWPALLQHRKERRWHRKSSTQLASSRTTLKTRNNM